MAFRLQSRSLGGLALVGLISLVPCGVASAKGSTAKTSKSSKSAKAKPAAKPAPKPVPKTAETAPKMAEPAARLTDIPELKRTVMSDWVSVKSGSVPAVGDGVADDTAAIQAAIDRVGRVGKEPRDARAPLTVYLPAGTYRITKSLLISDIAREYQAVIGVTLVGDGALTRIVWDGATDPQAAMIISDGLGYGRMDGFVLDGAGKAGVGLDHAAKRTFETEFDHYNLSFKNLPTAGIRIGHTTTTASAEMVYKNCAFDKCGTGISIEAFNDYDNTITGCDFRNSGRAIVLGYGTNGYIRDSHFENSSTADVISYGPLHPCSVRRCTSVGSKRFIEWASSVATLAVQDCQVESWTATDGAITLLGVPVTLFDCTFKNPPEGSAPINSKALSLIYSNIKAEGSNQILVEPRDATTNPVFEVPPGKLGMNLTSARQTFLETPPATGKVFDARAMGAVGDGQADDTDAVQATIDAARKQGKGAIAYFPPGQYKVNKTIEMTGSDYAVCGGGSGFYTGLVWDSPEALPILHIHDVDKVRLERMGVGLNGNQKNSRDILQDGTQPGSMTYESVWAWGTYMKAPDTRGLQIEGLPKGSTVHLRHIGGNATFTDCSRAHILIDAVWEGALVVEGANETQRDGLFGCLTRFNSSEPFGLYVKDNQSAIITDYYTESADAYLSMKGAAGQPSGRVTVAGIKVHTAVEPVISIDDYEGQISLFGMQYWSENFHLSHKGMRKLDLVVAGNMGIQDASKFLTELGPGATLTTVGNQFTGRPPSEVTEDGLKLLSVAMDDFRMLGALDLQINHPFLLPNGLPEKPVYGD